MKLEIEEIKDRDIRDGSRHFRMSSKNGNVEFSIDNEYKKLYAYEWACFGEGRIFLRGLENYASERRLKLVVNNVINPRLETILRKAGNYREYYVKVSEIDGDIIQCFEKED